MVSAGRPVINPRGGDGSCGASLCVNLAKCAHPSSHFAAASSAPPQRLIHPQALASPVGTHAKVGKSMAMPPLRKRRQGERLRHSPRQTAFFADRPRFNL